MKPKTTTAIAGETVTVRCPYPEQFETKGKFFYKWDGHYFTEVIRISETQRGRFSISDDTSSKVLRVRIRDVREDDGGVYYCAVWTGGDSVSYYSLYSEIQLHVFDSSVIITACVCATLLLIGGSALIYYKFKHSPVGCFDVTGYPGGSVMIYCTPKEHTRLLCHHHHCMCLCDSPAHWRISTDLRYCTHT
ncbi:hypothetical protein SRHO_G00177810 [Serrasalmus rhombeus]